MNPHYVLASTLTDSALQLSYCPVPEVSLGSRQSEDSSESDLLDSTVVKYFKSPPEDPQGVFFLFFILAVLLNHALHERASSKSVVEPSLQVNLRDFCGRRIQKGGSFELPGPSDLEICDPFLAL